MVNFDRMIKSRNFVLVFFDLYVNDLKNKIVFVFLWNKYVKYFFYKRIDIILFFKLFIYKLGDVKIKFLFFIILLKFIIFKVVFVNVDL